jgi:hypothetical protein
VSTPLRFPGAVWDEPGRSGWDDDIEEGYAGGSCPVKVGRGDL